MAKVQKKLIQDLKNKAIFNKNQTLVLLLHIS